MAKCTPVLHGSTSRCWSSAEQIQSHGFWWYEAERNWNNEAFVVSYKNEKYLRRPYEKIGKAKTYHQGKSNFDLLTIYIESQLQNTSSLTPSLGDMKISLSLLNTAEVNVGGKKEQGDRSRPHSPKVISLRNFIPGPDPRFDFSFWLTRRSPSCHISCHISFLSYLLGGSNP